MNAESTCMVIALKMLINFSNFTKFNMQPIFIFSIYRDQVIRFTIKVTLKKLYNCKGNITHP